MNKKLNDLYQSNWAILSDKLNEIMNDDSLKQKPTNPLLLNVNEKKYINSDIKVLILGQETNNWGDNFCDSINETLEIYNDFYNSGYATNSYGGHFWNGFNRFGSLLENKFQNKKISYLWSNVIRIGASGRNLNYPENYIYKIETATFNILEKELEILKPDIILFISGPNYDNNIRKILKDVEFINCDEGFTKRQIAKLKFKNHKNIFRTYHPNYLWRKGINKYFQTIINSIEIT